MHPSTKWISDFSGTIFYDGVTCIHLCMIYRDPRGVEGIYNDGCKDSVDDADIMIASVVVHWQNTPTIDVFNTIRKFMIKAAACPYTPKPGSSQQSRNHILLYAPAGVQRQDKFVIQHKGHGTNVRFQYWRDEARNLAKELGWKFVDQYDLTLPHSLEPLKTDMAHYLANDAMDPIVDELLGKTGLCD